MKTKAPHSLNARINYAIGCLLDGTANNRAFEACFEMYDGMYIAIILTRRAEQNPKLKDAIMQWWSRTNPRMPEPWIVAANHNIRLSDDEIKTAALAVQTANQPALIV